MLVAAGTRVRLKYTGDEGVVTELLGDEMVQVLLDDGDEIPVFSGDLERPGDVQKNPVHKPVKAKIIETTPAKPRAIPDLPEAQQQYAILKSMGIQLGFLPELLPDGTTDFYKTYLINDTPYEALFSFSFDLPGKHLPKVNGKIAAESLHYLGDLPFSYLNDSPQVSLECWQITTEGTGPRQHKTFKIKAKHFFGHVITAPILNKAVHHYLVFENFNPPDKKKEEDLKSYTKRNTRPVRKLDSDHHFVTRHEVAEYAHFEQELDLHIENLSTTWQKMNNADIIRLQLQTFETYLAKAIKLGVERVFIIHGLGKGRLRNEIATRLMQHPDVVTFKNEFHERYGYGATEVILG